jgi:hypothetical protein
VQPPNPRPITASLQADLMRFSLVGETVSMVAAEHPGAAPSMATLAATDPAVDHVLRIVSLACNGWDLVDEVRSP